MMRLQNPDDGDDGINVLQLNMGHRSIAHDMLMTWLMREERIWIVCIQEPYFTKKGLPNMPRSYGAFWATNSAETKKRIRALIIAPTAMKGYLVTQRSSTDCAIVRFDTWNLSVASVYCAVDLDIGRSMADFFAECEDKKKVIGCIDSNAYHENWGFKMRKGAKWRCRQRGKTLNDEVEEAGVYVCNEVPHLPTFVGNCSEMSDSFIDITLCTMACFNMIAKWQVHDETMGADHRCISFKFLDAVRNKMCKAKAWGVPWKKMNKKMVGVVTKVLKEQVKKDIWVHSCKQVDSFLEKHVSQVRGILHDVYSKENKGKKATKGRTYWWCKEVAEVHGRLKRARGRMRKYKHDDLRAEFYAIRQEFRKEVAAAKLRAWRTFTTSIKDPWAKLIKIVRATASGKLQSRTLTDLNGHYAEDIKETLTMLGQQFYPQKKGVTVEQMNVERTVNERLGSITRGPEITLCEFRTAFTQMSKNTAPGFDEITNSILTILIKECRYEGRYLKLFNTCLHNNYFPDVWKSAKVVLIPKTAEDSNSVKAYRPISLTSVYAKLFERILLARLLYYLKAANVMTDNQHAYNRGRSTQTALYQMFDIVQQAFSKRGGNVCVVVFLDITGAFDRTWHMGILAKLLQYGVPDYLVAIIRSFLTNRKAYFEDADASHKVDLEQGCPQGGVLSPILWNVIFNEMLALETDVKNTRSVLKTIGYADDAAVICTAKTVDEATDIINAHLKKIFDWSVSNRVEFNANKLAAMTLSNRAVRPPPAKIRYNNIPVKAVTAYKYLGLWVDDTLSWKLHIDNVLHKLTLVTRSLRGLSREGWGIGIDVHRLLFHSIFVPVMTYGISIWGFRATAKQVCMRFDKVMRSFCLQATRCYKSTATSYLFAVMRTSPFATILCNEVLKTSVQQFHITHAKREQVYETYARNRKTREVPQSADHHYYICRRGLEDELRDIQFDNADLQYEVHPTQWALTTTKIEGGRTASFKGSQQEGWVVYTDASRATHGMGWGVIIFKNGFCVQRNYGSLTRCSVFTAEAYAVYQALRSIRQVVGLRPKEIVEIRTDSLALVRVISRTHHDEALLNNIKVELREAEQRGMNVLIRWVPSHQGVPGNEMVDVLAKRATDSRRVMQIRNSQRSLRTFLRKRERIQNAQEWENFTSRNVKLFLPDIEGVQRFIRASPSTALCQIVSGHTRLNDFVCMKLGLINSALCKCGKDRETISHFLFDCGCYDALRDEIWPDFRPDYDFITKDWEKLNRFVIQTGRFEGSIREMLLKNTEDCAGEADG